MRDARHPFTPRTPTAVPIASAETISTACTPEEARRLAVDERALVVPDRLGEARPHEPRPAGNPDEEHRPPAREHHAASLAGPPARPGTPAGPCARRSSAEAFDCW